MAIPHTCPLCGGKGVDWPTDLTAGGACRPCSGSGIVWEYLPPATQMTVGANIDDAKGGHLNPVGKKAALGQ